ncbi:MAG: hypothetical protein CVT79_13395 [Alphaproteobacteria bacterium HGW-Alphaproteobacteria-18]|nr:MAG: hypothetical protein CVT79_13395 [Alphaproteobacteria bacterium HGW-Alphaproteobacteria-18]
MHSLIVNGLHLTGAIIGFFLIYRLSGSPQLSRFTWPFTLVWGAVMAGVMFWNTQPLLEHIFWDFRYCYWLAGELVWHGPQALMGAYNEDKLVFVNLPIVAYLFAPFGLMSPLTASIVFSLIGFGVMGLIWRMLVKMYGLDSREAALLAFALCVFGPLVYTFKVGNTSQYILALLLGGLVMARAGKDLSAGALFGIAAVIKPALLLIGVLYFLRGRWSVVAGGAAVVAGSVVLSLLIFGWDMHVFWYETTIEPFSSNPVLASANQTLKGMVARFEAGDARWQDYDLYVLAPASQLIAQALTLSLVAGIAYAVWRSGRAFRPTNQDIETEVLIIVALGMSVSALSWAHYHVWLLPAIVLLWVRSRQGEPLARLRWPLAATYALLAGTVFVSHSMTLGRFGFASNFIVSHWLWGALATLILLSIVRAQRTPPAA